MKNGREKHILVLRYLSIRKELRLAFTFALISVLIIELILKNYEAVSAMAFRAGEMYLKLCYSIVASSIFFFINQHLPKEEKKLRLVSFISNRLGALQNEVRFLFIGLNPKFDNLHNLSKEDIETGCKMTNPRQPISTYLEPSFPDWYEYLQYKTAKIREILGQLTVLHDSLDNDLLEALLSFDLPLYTMQILNRNHGNDNLDFLSISFSDLKDRAIDIRLIELEKYGMLRHASGERYKAWRKKTRKV